MKKEPAVIAMIVMYLLTRLVSAVLPEQDQNFFLNPQVLEWIAEGIIALGTAFWIRAKVFSESTVRKAGYTPEELTARAKSPAIPEATKP